MRSMPPLRTLVAFAAAAGALGAIPGEAGDGIALTPPMGWNSWNKFGCNVSEKLIRETADNVVSTGL